MENQIFSLCHLENNKIKYEYIKYNIEEIINQLSNSVILILNDEYFNIEYFIRDKKYLRYFRDEKYNCEKTTYVCWDNKLYGNENYLSAIISLELLLKLPYTIRYIKFNNKFNYYINTLAETNISHIIFGNNFNNPVDNLPWVIEYLYFGDEFNQGLENLPGCLKKLLFSIASKFNQKLDCLPNCLEYLFLPADYSFQLNNLPNFLLHLELCFDYSHTLNNLPKSLEKFIFYSTNRQTDWYNRKKYSYIKATNFQIPQLPCYYTDTTKQDINWIEKVFVRLPPNLKLLDLTYSFKLNMLSDYIDYCSKDLNFHVKKELVRGSQVLDNLPLNLQVLKYPSNYNLILIERIPQNIQRLFLSNKFNQSIDRLLNPNFGTSKPRPPTKITHLIFGDEFNHPVLNLPDTLTNLYFGAKFNKSVNNLPNSLQVLVFGNNFNLLISNLPPNLIEITFGADFNQPINNIKPLLKKIIFTKYDTFEKYKITNEDGSNINVYNYNKKINKLPPDTKIYLPKVSNYSNKPLDDFYSFFSEYSDHIEYY